MISEAEFHVGLGAADIFSCWSRFVGCNYGLVNDAASSAVSVVGEWAGVPAVASLRCSFFIFAEYSFVMT